MLTRRRRFTERDGLDEVVHIEPDAEFVEHRTRDLGIPDGVWWGIAALIGFGVMIGLIELTYQLGDVLSRAVSAGGAGAIWAFAARRWGHRRFRWRAAIADALWFGLLFAGAILVHAAADRLFAVLTE